jgi:hypothetical protein
MNPQAREELDGSGLVIKALKSSKEKIDRLVLHPVQPWVAFADRTGAVTIWDYETEEVRPYFSQISHVPLSALLGISRPLTPSHSATPQKAI